MNDISAQTDHQQPRVGNLAPDFSLPAIAAGEREPRVISRDELRGRWVMLVFYPRDFSFVCPTELTAFSARIQDFRSRGCELLGISVDPIELHREWLETPPDDGGLGPLQFPLGSDVDGTVGRQFGVWIPEKQVSTRGLFIIDPDGVLQYAVVHNLSVGRSPDEVLRVLDALRDGGLCPASWTTADGTLDIKQALQPGRILGHYRIRRTLGMGTFGTVFGAWDIHLERKVALKVLGKVGEESHEELLAEARTAARLIHPNICTIYAVEQEDGLPLIAMEFIEGPSLVEAIADGLDDRSVARVARGIATGLAAAHENDVIHGDLKPANVMLTKDGAPKILDFGLANRFARQRSLLAETTTSEVDDDDESGATVIGSLPLDDEGNPVTISGTPAYMSPEQSFGRPLTPASDAYSFGLVLYEMLTGSRALPEEEVMPVINDLRTIDFAATLPSQVPEQYRPVLSALLQRDQGRRMALSEAAALLAAIQRHKK